MPPPLRSSSPLSGSVLPISGECSEALLNALSKFARPLRRTHPDVLAGKTSTRSTSTVPDIQFFKGAQVTSKGSYRPQSGLQAKQREKTHDGNLR